MTINLRELSRGTTREEWKRFYRELRMNSWEHIHGTPQMCYHFWMNGKRLNKAMRPGEYATRVLDVRPYKWMTLLQDVEVLPLYTAPRIAILCSHASDGHEFIRTHYSITARLSELVYQVKFESMPVVLAQVVTSEEALRGLELHGYEIIGVVSSRMIDIARSRVR